MNDRFVSSRWLLALLAGAGVLFLFPLALHPTWFPFSPGSKYSDLLIAHLSSASYIHHAVETWGQVPLWNATILGGYPLLADPLSGLWYPPFWLLAFVPEALTANALLWMHLVFGGFGMWLLLRNEGLGAGAALTGALAFAGMPKLVGHVGLGHLSLVAAVAWTPWALLAAGRAVIRCREPYWGRRFLVVGILLGVAFLADPRWAVPLALVTLGYGAWRARGRDRPPGRARPIVAGLGIAALATLAVTVSFGLPFLEFLQDTTRSALGAAQADIYALPPERLLGLLLITPGGWGEWMASMGSTVFVLAAAGLSGSARKPLFWGLAAVAAVLLALGSLTPIGSLVANLPGLDVLRVPARWLFIVGLSMAAVAAYGIEAVTSPSGEDRRKARRGALAAGGLILGISVAVIVVAGFQIGAAVSGVTAVVATGLIWVIGKQARTVWSWVVFSALVVLELAWIDASLIDPRSPAVAQGEGKEVVSAIGTIPNGGRIFSPSYSVSQDIAASQGLSLADGVHPLQLAAYVDFMGAATGMETDGYSVTLPPFPGGDPSADWAPDLDAYRLGLLGVERIVSAYPIKGDGFSLVAVVGSTWVYRNDAARPRAWIEPADSETSPRIVRVDLLEWSPNRVRILAKGPGRLVLADPAFSGWRASVNGVPTSIETYQGILRAVEIAAGEQEVVFAFMPISLLTGAAVALAAMIGVVIVWRRP